MIKTCQKCGKSFETHRSKKLFCPVCYEEAWRERKREQGRLTHELILTKTKVAQSIGAPTKTLDEWCREAAECNLDYGTYRTLVEMQGKTFEKLKAQNQNRSVSLHARKWHTRSIRDE